MQGDFRTLELVKKLRRVLWLENLCVSLKAISSEFGISVATVHRIIH